MLGDIKSNNLNILWYKNIFSILFDNFELKVWEILLRLEALHKILFAVFEQLQYTVTMSSAQYWEILQSGGVPGLSKSNKLIKFDSSVLANSKS